VWYLLFTLVAATALLALARTRRGGEPSARTANSLDLLPPARDSSEAAGAEEPGVVTEKSSPPSHSKRQEPSVTFHSAKISVQTATQRICEQAGCHYDWPRSYANTQPDCRRYIKVDLKDMPLREALDIVVVKNGLVYRLEGKNVWLERE